MSGDWLRGLAARIPARCEVCGAWPAQAVCVACVRRFAAPVARCGRCARPLPPGLACGACPREPAGPDACLAAVGYEYPWPDLVARFKFRGEPGWAGTFARLMRAAPGVAGALAAANRVLPLPLAPRRLAERGYNQAMELARRLAPAKVANGLLLRVRETAPQATLDRDARRRNLAGAFAVAPASAASLRGQHLLLVDDVMTSGASLADAARALREAGARRVTALVLARTDEA